MTPRTEANVNTCQTPRDSLKSRPGTSPKQETDFKKTGQTDVNPMDKMVAANGHVDSVLGRNVFHENGYGSSPDKQRSATISRDPRHCQYESHQEIPKAFETPAAVDSLPQGNSTRTESDAMHCEKIEDQSPTGARDYSKTGSSHSEVAKIVPLKPQRSKKSLNKENKGAHPQTQSQYERGVSAATGDVHMTQSKDGFCESGRRGDDNTVAQSATEVVKENAGAARYREEAATSHQQQPLHQQIKKELTAGQSHWTRGSMVHDDHFQNSEFKESLLSGPRFPPTAPPRTLPLKTQWSRDRQSNMDNSHVHHRTPGQETAKRKQAVKPSAPPNLFVHHLKFKKKKKKTLHELQAMSILFFTIKKYPSPKKKKKKKESHTHSSELMWLCMRKQKITFLHIASLAQRAFLLSPPPQKLDICLAIFRTLRAFKQSSQCLSFRSPLVCPHLNFLTLTPGSLLPTSSRDKGGCCCKEPKTFFHHFSLKPLIHII